MIDNAYDSIDLVTSKSQLNYVYFTETLYPVGWYNE